MLKIFAALEQNHHHCRFRIFAEENGAESSDCHQGVFVQPFSAENVSARRINDIRAGNEPGGNKESSAGSRRQQTADGRGKQQRGGADSQRQTGIAVFMMAVAAFLYLMMRAMVMFFTHKRISVQTVVQSSLFV